MKETHFKVHPEWKWCSKERRKSVGGKAGRRLAASVSDDAIVGNHVASQDGTLFDL